MAEMTFIHILALDELGRKAYTPSSNSNKYRHDFHAFVQSLIDSKPFCKRCGATTGNTNVDYNIVCPNCR